MRRAAPHGSRRTASRTSMTAPAPAAADGEVADHLWKTAIFADGFESGTADQRSVVAP